jgi:hypothetical protein
MTTTQNLGQGSRCSDRDSHRVPHEYKLEALRLDATCSAEFTLNTPTFIFMEKITLTKRSKNGIVGYFTIASATTVQNRMMG